MILRQLQIENFKCFQKQQTFDFGKITLLTGANSSGKSSVIHAVLGTLQSGEYPATYSPNGSYVNMGDFKEVVYNHNEDLTIKISFEYEKSGTIRTINTEWKQDEVSKLFINNEFKFAKISLNESDETLKTSVQSDFQDYSLGVNYIGAFRLDPQRTYLEKNRKEERIKKDGEGYLEQIIAWETQKSPRFEQLISEMKELSLLENIRSKRLGGGIYEFKIQTNVSGQFSSLSDVGYGISQFLPIMVADLQLPDNSQLFLSQPEIHLHPSVQSSFGDYLVRQINKSDKRYVVETHSEYLLNKLRLAIVKGELKQEDISVYYLENNGVDTSVHKIQFEKNGQINGAPSSFFETYMADSMEIVLNATD